MFRHKISLEINDLADFQVGEVFFEQVASETLDVSNVNCLEGKEISISVALVSEDEIRQINNNYRQKNQVTDVLSFAEYAKIEEICNNVNKEIFLGEIILCPSYIKRSAVEQNVTFEFELAYIFSHGILHLLGFFHGEKMFFLQEKVTKKVIK